MIGKSIKSIITILLLLLFVKLNAQFEFSYTGPDTLFLNEDCTAILDWGHPQTPSVISTVGNEIISFDVSDISGGYSIGDSLHFQEVIDVTYQVIDSENNSDFFSFTIYVVDTTKPVVTILPIDKSYTCETNEDTIISNLSKWYHNFGYMVGQDNCGELVYGADKTFEEIETEFNQSVNYNCGNTRSVTVAFNISDQYGNSDGENYTARFYTYDNKKPNLPTSYSPIPLITSCNENSDSLLTEWLDNTAGYTATDNCTPENEITWYFLWNRQDGTHGREDVGNKPYDLTFLKNCTDSIKVSFVAKDACGNERAAYYTYAKSIDDSIPYFSELPQDTLINCSSDIPRPQIFAYDACKGDLSVTLTETNTQNSDPENCLHYDYSITQSWNADDGCGHQISHSRTITVVDTVGPSFDVPEDILVNCTDIENFDITGEPQNLLDNCYNTPELTYTDEVNGDGCHYGIFRTWRAVDVCNNFTEKTQILTIEDTVYPEVIQEPIDIFIECDSSIIFSEVFSDWLSNKGYGEITDNCGKVYSFAAIPGSYT
ncbi:MAG: hypothetical protein R2771_12030 [Saprospiraceae bacterium]